MCCDTKEKIVSALRELMQERPLQKITVQDIMNCAGMKRQSFYYHFQDIYEVVGWEVDRKLLAPMCADTNESGEKWFCRFLALLDEDRAFYRKAIKAVGRSRAVARCSPYIRPQAACLLFPGRQSHAAHLSDEETFAVDFVTYALVNYLIDNVLSREPLDTELSRKRITVSCRAAACFRPQPVAPVPTVRSFEQPA